MVVVIILFRELFRTSDGGTIALDWLMNSDVAETSFQVNGTSTATDIPLLILVPGLTSDQNSPYIKEIAYKMAKHGWNVVVSNHRGLRGVPLTSECFYTAGKSDDLGEVVNYLHREQPETPLYALGTSLGANILAYIKIAQAVSSRPDLIPHSYLDELSLLQDHIFPFSTQVAFNMIEKELGLPLDQLFSEISPEPVAAASLGQADKLFSPQPSIEQLTGFLPEQRQF